MRPPALAVLLAAALSLSCAKMEDARSGGAPPPSPGATSKGDLAELPDRFSRLVLAPEGKMGGKDQRKRGKSSESALRDQIFDAPSNNAPAPRGLKANAFGSAGLYRGNELNKREAQNKGSLRWQAGETQKEDASKQLAVKKPPAVTAPTTPAKVIHLGDAEAEQGRKSGKKRIALEELTIEGRDGDRGETAGWDFEDDASETARPLSFLPRTFYFENTYLGGNAAFEERRRRLDRDFGSSRPYAQAALPLQDFDPPEDAGMALTARLDRSFVDKPQRVILQVGLQGSERFGWRRPPLDVVLVVDQPVVARQPEVVIEAITGLVRKLGPQDRLGVVRVAEAPYLMADVSGVREARAHLVRELEALKAGPETGPAALGRAVELAGERLRAAAGNTARVPGTQMVVLLSGGGGDRVRSAADAAHANNVMGQFNSVIDVSGELDNDLWSVASAGHGNYHRAAPGANAKAVLDAIDSELESLSRVIARLLRVNVRLAPDVEVIRVIGSRPLEELEKQAVKAREVATDQNLSKTLGVQADRGDDDDGVQTVIPYFYGGDAHVVLVELWVKKPGRVADVSLKYKDMVKLENATAQATASVAGIPRPPTPAHAQVRRNLRGFTVATLLKNAGAEASRGNIEGCDGLLEQAEGYADGEDAGLVKSFRTSVRALPGKRLSEALDVAGAQRIGVYRRK